MPAVPNALAKRPLPLSKGLPPLRPSQSLALQRQCACGGSSGSSRECSECKAKRESSLQRKESRPAPRSIAPLIVHDVLRSPGQPLDAPTRAFMEPRFGQDLGGVRVHTDAKAAESARAVNALAYTVGGDIAFGAGQYQPNRNEGKRLLAHELAHTLQQTSGSAPPAGEIHLGSPSALEEKQAAQAAQQVIAAPDPGTVFTPTGQSPAALQRQTAPAAPAETTAPAASTAPAAQDNADPPTPVWAGQIPISPFNFQLPFGNPTGPGAGGALRSTRWDQAYQPNFALGVVHSWRYNPGASGWNLGWDVGGFLQPGLTYSLDPSNRPTTGLMGTGSSRTLTGESLQAYIQPAWIIFSIDLGGGRSFQGSAFAQLGGAYTASSIPGLPGWSISGQIGPQLTADIIPNLLQGVLSTTVGYGVAFPSQPLPGDPSAQGSPFYTFNLGIQVILPWSYFPRPAPRSPERTETPAPRSQEPEQTTPPVTTPPVNTPSATPPANTQSQVPPPPPPLPGSVQIFFQQDHPRPDEAGAGLSVLTPEGRAGLTALAQTVRDHPNLRLLLIGHSSIEGPADPAARLDYNDKLGQRRAEWLAKQLGIDASRLAAPPDGELRSECHITPTGVYSCGEAGADSPPNPRDRNVLVMFYNPPS